MSLKIFFLLMTASNKTLPLVWILKKGLVPPFLAFGLPSRLPIVVGRRRRRQLAVDDELRDFVFQRRAQCRHRAALARRRIFADPREQHELAPAKARGRDRLLVEREEIASRRRLVMRPQSLTYS